MKKSIDDNLQIQETKMYQTEDGETFSTYEEAREHAKQINSTNWRSKALELEKEIEMLKQEISSLKALKEAVLPYPYPTPPVLPYDPTDPRNRAWYLIQNNRNLYFGVRGDVCCTINQEEFDRLSPEEKKKFVQIPPATVTF